MELSQSVVNTLRVMFDEYQARYDKSANTQSSQSQQTSSQHSQSLERMEVVEDELDWGYERMDNIYKEMVDENGELDTRDELKRYLKESVENPKLMKEVEYNVLSWWKGSSSKFHVLAEMARDLLAMQVSSVASESAFSTSGRIITPSRRCLTHYMVEVLMCTEQWMMVNIRLNGEALLITKEQIISEFEYENKLQRDYDKPQDEEEDQEK